MTGFIEAGAVLIYIIIVQVIFGTSMEVDGQELFRSDKKIIISMDNSGTGRILAEGTTTVTVASGDADPITFRIGAGIAVVKNGRLAAGNEH